MKRMAIFITLIFQALCSYSCDANSRLDTDTEWPTYVNMEKGSISSDGFDNASIEGYEQWIRSSFFIKTEGATGIELPRCYRDSRIVQYDKDHCIISISNNKCNCLLDNNCTYVRFAIKGDLKKSLIGVRFTKNGTISEDVVEEKRIQMTFPYDRLVYEVSTDICTTALLMLPPNYTITGPPVPLIIWDSGDGSFSNWNTYTCSTYEGRKNGIRYLRDQGFAVLEIYSWGSYYYKKYSGCGDRSAMPIPTHLVTHEKGVEYVLSRYNIDAEHIFHISKSGSGKLSLYWAMFSPSFNLNAIYAFAPVFDDLNFVGWGMKGYRQALFEELKMQGTPEEVNAFIECAPYDYDIEYLTEHKLTLELSKSWQMHKPLGRSFIEKNAEKFKLISVDWLNVEGQTLEEAISATHVFSELFWEGYNRHYNSETKKFSFSWDDRALPAQKSNTYTRRNLVRKGNAIPFTVIMSPTDEQTPYWNALEVVEQFRNGGYDATMITLESGGHSGPDLSVSGPNAIQHVTTRTGSIYDNVSIGWYLAVEDIYDKYLNEKE